MLAAIAGGAVALVCTRSSGLSKELAAQFWAGAFKVASRRAGFYLRASELRLVLADDPFFNFTEGLSQRQLSSLETWLLRRRNALPEMEHAGHMMLVHAGQAHLALERADHQVFEQKLAQFAVAANRLLAQVDKMPTHVPDPVPLAEREDTPGFADTAGEVLTDFEHHLPMAKWNWFVIGGTYLGIVRDQAFLPHDVDLDVGVFVEDIDTDALAEVFAASPKFSIAKFDYQTEIERDEQGTAFLVRRPAMLKLVHASGINLDVFVHERRDGMIWHGSGVNKWVNVPFGLSHYTIEGQDVLGPDNPDVYLKEHYGEWRVVVKDFSCVTGTTNLSFVKNLHTIAVLLKRLGYFAKHNPPEAQKILRELNQQGFISSSSETPPTLVENFV